MRPLIGISTNFLTVDSGKFLGMERIYVNKDYSDAVEKAGGIPLLLPPSSGQETVAEYLRICKGFLFSGGGDINPLLYGCEPMPKLEAVHTSLDEAQLLLIREVLRVGKPLLAVCRGAQLLNVALGGTLYQDESERTLPSLLHSQQAPRADKFHRIVLEADSIPGKLFGRELNVNSFHHQSIRDLGEGLRIVATASDGVTEAVERQSGTFVLGVQWHPEMMLTGSDEMLPLFSAFINAAKTL